MISELKIVPLIFNEKCAEVYRNNGMGTYTFHCCYCDQTLDYSTGDEFLRHFDTHYMFDGQVEEKMEEEEYIFEEEYIVEDEHIVEEENIVYEPLPVEDKHILLEQHLQMEKENLPEAILTSNESTQLNDNQNNKLYKCNNCHRSFSKRYDYILHYKKHKNCTEKDKALIQRFYNCSICLCVMT